MRLTDVAWTRDHHGKPVLALKIDGHPAFIRSGQKTELTRRGLVDGVVFLDSERSSQRPDAYIHGDYAPAFQGLDLVGCTDDPGVFSLYQDMCDAIRTGSWHVGARPSDGGVHGAVRE
jgi:hypothetical protein